MKSRITLSNAFFFVVVALLVGNQLINLFVFGLKPSPPPNLLKENADARNALQDCMTRFRKAPKNLINSFKNCDEIFEYLKEPKRNFASSITMKINQEYYVFKLESPKGTLSDYVILEQ